MPPAVKTKKIYRPFARLEKFYTGGSICVAPDETSVVCACADEVKVVEVTTGRVLHTFLGDTEPITSIACSPNGHHIFAASRSLTTKCWDLRTHKCFRTFRAHKSPTIDMAVDASGGLVATASAQREVRVWDVAGGFCTHSFTGHEGIVLRVIFHPTQLLLATSGDDGVVCLWDLVEKRRSAELRGHVSAVTAVAWAPSTWHLLSAGRDKVVALWDIRTYTKLKIVAVFDSVETLVVFPADSTVPGRDASAGSAAASDSGAEVVFATGGELGEIRVWDAGSGRQLHAMKRVGGGSHARELVQLLPLERSGGMIAASADCRVTLLRVASDALRPRRTLLGNNDEVTGVAFVGTPVTAESIAQELTALRGEDSDAAPPASLPPQLVLSTNSDLVYVLSTATMNCTATLAGHSDTVLAIAVIRDPESDAWILASASKDKAVRVWDLASGRCLAIGTGHLSAVSCLALSLKGNNATRSGAMLFSGGADKLARVWDLDGVLQALRSQSTRDGAEKEGAQGAAPSKLPVVATVAAHEKDVNCVAIAPTGRTAASGGADRVAKLWTLPALAAPRTLRGHRRGIWDVRFAPVEAIVMTASGDATLRLWNVKDGACLRTLSGHGASVLRAAFVSLGTQILSTGSDGLAKMWNVTTGECVATMEVAEEKVWGLDVGGVAEAAALTGAADGSLTLWADCTAADEATAVTLQEARLGQEQELDNALMDRNYLKAARLAFRLQQPGRLLAVVQQVLSDADPVAAHATLCTLVAALTPEELSTALGYARDWNTSSRNCMCAQVLLQAVLGLRRPGALAEIRGIADAAEALLLYTERHFKRIDRLLQSTFVLDYLLQGMQLYSAEGPDAEGAGANGVTNGATTGARVSTTDPKSTPYTRGIAALAALETRSDAAEDTHAAHRLVSGAAEAGAGTAMRSGSDSEDADVAMPAETHDNSDEAADVEGRTGAAADAVLDADLPGWGDGFEQMPEDIVVDDIDDDGTRENEKESVVGSAPRVAAEKDASPRENEQADNHVQDNGEAVLRKKTKKAARRRSTGADAAVDGKRKTKRRRQASM